MYWPTFAIFVRETNPGTYHENAGKNIGESDQQICRGANTRESTAKK